MKSADLELDNSQMTKCVIMCAVVFLFALYSQNG